MAKYFLLIVFLLAFFEVNAQNYIDIQQNRIDLMDGIADSKNANSPFNYLYFDQIDIVQEILSNGCFEVELIMKIEMVLYLDLYELDASFMEKQQKGPAEYMYLEEFLLKKSQNKASYYLEANPTKAYELIRLICETSEAKTFLNKEAKNNPAALLQHYPKLQSCNYLQVVISEAAMHDPIAASAYFEDTHPFYQHLLLSNNPMDKLILDIYRQSAKPDRTLSLLNDIFLGKLSISAADSLAKEDDEHFLKYLLSLASKEDVFGRHSIDVLLTSMCTKKIRLINAAFEAHDSPKRFESLSHYSASELYHMIVYSEEEIFTSSFNGIYGLFINQLKTEEIRAYELLSALQFNQFRTFIKMCSTCGKLEDFFSLLSADEKTKLIAKFVHLNEESDLLKEAVCIADALGSITDESSINCFESNLLENYQTSVSPNLKLSYTLLIKLFAEKSIAEKSTFQEIANKIAMPSLLQVGNAALYGADGIHTQLHLFYDDEDGKISFATFIKMWDNNYWKITDHQEFVLIKNVQNNAVQILANKPSAAENGVELIHNYLAKENSEIEVLVHRGHSFYVVKSLFNLTADVNIVLLGSCGGYKQVVDVLNKAPNAHIISTKQIGSYSVNNPILYQLANMVNKGEEIYWDQFWKTLAIKLKYNTYATERFKEYVPPHQNLGAAFIQAYRQHLND